MKRVSLVLFLLMTLQTPSFALVSEVKSLWELFGKGMDKAMAIKEVVVDVSEMKKLLEKLKIIEENSLVELDALNVELEKLNTGYEIYSDVPGYALDQVPGDVWEYKSNLEFLSTKQSKYSHYDFYNKSTIWADKKITDLENYIKRDTENSNVSQHTKDAMKEIDDNTKKMDDADAQSLRKHQSRVNGETLKIQMQNLELQKKLLEQAKKTHHKDRVKALEIQIENNRKEVVFKGGLSENTSEPISAIFRTFFR